MTDEEMQAAIEAAVAKATANLTTQIEKLNAKNKELLSEKQAAKSAAEEAAERAAQIEEERARATNDVEAIKKALETKHAKELAAIKAKADSADAQLHKLLVDGGIKDAFGKANIAPQFAEAAAALLKTKGEISILDGVATINGEPIESFVTSWAGTDGKAFVAAAQNAGGGSLGNSTGTTTTAWTADNFKARTSEFFSIAEKNPSQAIQIAKSVGAHDIAAAISGTSNT